MCKFCFIASICSLVLCLLIKGGFFVFFESTDPLARKFENHCSGELVLILMVPSISIILSFFIKELIYGASPLQMLFYVNFYLGCKPGIANQICFAKSSVIPQGILRQLHHYSEILLPNINTHLFNQKSRGFFPLFLLQMLFS